MKPNHDDSGAPGADRKHRSRRPVWRLLFGLVLCALLAGCRGCGAPMTFEELMGVWEMDVERALSEDADYRKMNKETQAEQKASIERTARTTRFVYTKDHLQITMLLTPDAAAKRGKDGRLLGRTQTLVEDRILKHETGKDGTLILQLQGDKGDPRIVVIRRLGKDRIEMTQPGAAAPPGFRFFKRVP